LGQITGPHGSGKSTALCSLQEAAQQAGWQLWAIRADEPWPALPTSDGRWLAAIDCGERVGGIEHRRLTAWQRAGTVGGGRRRAVPVPTHLDRGWPLLHRRSVDLPLVERVVARLLDPRGVPDDVLRRHGVTADLLTSLHARHGDNLRELLFELY